MIDLHRIDGTKILVNLDLIELIEETPDTVVTLTNDHKYVVKEKIHEIVEKIVDFKCSIHFKKLIIVDADEQKNTPVENKRKSFEEPTVTIIKTLKDK
jgi:flagellar protein FlbD